MFRKTGNGLNRHSASTPNLNTLVDLLSWRTQQQPDRVAYSFLVDGEAEEVRLTYKELDEQARRIGLWLQSLNAGGGERVLLLYPPGLEYVAAFYGCLYAGAVAVPAYPPRFNRSLIRLQTIVHDSQATVALTTASLLSGVERHFEDAPDLGALRWLATDSISNYSAEEWKYPAVNGKTLAFLQYTSGSTGTPKGVMLTHGNLLHNSALIQHGFETTSEDKAIIWLPPYHDMGLIGGILQPLYAGFHVTLMSPVAFLQRPFRWLQAVSRYGATISGGPNFAYELCLNKISTEQRETLNLSNWAMAFNGAEPIRRETLERFTAAFEPYGFRREAFYPCYGLAEVTLIATGGRKADPPVVQTFGARAIEEHRVVEAAADDEDSRTLIGCGQNLPGQKIAIVNPETLSPCSPESIGEIWVSGLSVAQGYWNRPEETERTFRAYLADNNEEPFLRTGDLGFLKEGELFVTGRLKDLIIIRGRNHYPQDIELTIEKSHASLKPGCGAAFSVEVGDEERLVIVHEVERQYRKVNVDDVAVSVRRAVAEEHALDVYAVVLIKPGTIPKTSSGKIQRHASRANFLAGGLEIVSEWKQSLGNEVERATVGAGSNAGQADEQPGSTGRSESAEAIQAWLVSRISERLKVLPSQIDIRESFAHYGLDSVAAVSLSGELEQWLGRRLSPTLVYEHPTIAALASHLAKEASVVESLSTGGAKPLNEADPIAIIGIGCRFPGAKDPEAFWQLLRDGVDAITEGAAQRWDNSFYDADPTTPGKINTYWGGFLDQIDHFDPNFFGISPREATRMDPQQRLLLEVAWEALEDAGQAPERLAGTQTGIFVGIASNDYGQLQWNDPRLIDAYAGTGNAFSIAANRLSYHFDFRGPSMAVDTACSSSLVAVHLACRSLWNGESKLALAGGVNLILSPAITINFTKAGVMAADGRCKTFDARANGYVRGEGAGMVVLKPLADALSDGDPIYAVIRSTAVNQDGRTNGLMAPSRQSQEAVLREAYSRAGISPGELQYVEAHGTGTLLGDPIEAGALGAVLALGRPAERPCAIGSVKTNIGHLEAAAGVAGLIKVALSLKHRAIPPSLHFQEPNPYIPFDELPLRVQQSLCAWPEEAGRALAGVSSFGFGGTNAHVVLEGVGRDFQPTSRNAGQARKRAQLLPLSARDEASLQALAQSFQSYLTGNENAVELHDLCYTAGARRTHHDQRLACVVHSLAELSEQLEAFTQGEFYPGMSQGRRSTDRRPRVVFVFPGQGSQWFGMGRELLQEEPVFREAIERCDRAMRREVDWSLLEELNRDEALWRMGEIDVVQPTLFAIQVALATLWRSWGVEPEAVIGQSMGEVAAAHVAGALSLEDALKVICRRSKLLKRMSGRGSMAVVELSYEQAQRALAGYEDRLSIAVSSSPVSTVLSGETDALLELMERLQQQDIFCRQVKVDVASHSPQMNPLRDELLELLEGLQPVAGAIPIYSTVTGQINDGHSFDAAYWVRNLREPVLFSQTAQQLAEPGRTVFVEISPHPLLTGAIQQVFNGLGCEGSVLASTRRGEEERAAMLVGLGALYTMGYPVDWAKHYPDKGLCVRLPSYPWQRERFWLETDAPQGSPRTDYIGAGMHPLLGRHLLLASPAGAHCWESELDLRSLSYLNDHRIQGEVVLPGAAFIEMGLSAAAQLYEAGTYALSEIEFHKALFLSGDDARKVQLIITPGVGEVSFHVYSAVREAKPEAAWTLHAVGKIRLEVKDATSQVPPANLAEQLLARGGEEIEPEEFYGKLQAAGLEYGSLFQGIERLHKFNGESLAQLKIATALEGADDAYQIHPALLDSCWQALAATVSGEATASAEAATYVPVRVNRLRMYGRPGKQLWSRAVATCGVEQGVDILEGDIQLLDESGRVLIEITGLRCQRLEGNLQRPDEREDLGDWLYELQWQSVENLPATTASDSQSLQANGHRGWLIFADGKGVGERLAQLLSARGERCLLVFKGEAYERVDEERFRLNPSEPDDLKQLLDALKAEQPDCRAVVHLWSLDAEAAIGDDPSTLESAQTVGCLSVLHLVQSLTEYGWPASPRLWLVTRGVQAVGRTSISEVEISQSPLWGLGRVIALEHPELRCSMVDLDCVGEPVETELLCAELCQDGAENQIALRGQSRYALRLARYSQLKPQAEDSRQSAETRELALPRTPAFRLSMSSPYGLDSLSLEPAARRQPGPGEIEIQVSAAGLNFRDILKAMGMYPGVSPDQTWLGDECAGRVVALGEGVEDFRIGDEVIAIAPNSFGAYVTTCSYLVAHKPSGLSFEEAAALPIAYATAYYALNHLGRIGRGERVLIHAAAGGVGLAAVRLAQLAGAEIFATAGSAEKRAFLQSIGVRHVMDSRSLEFADEVLRLTDGEGLDLVLNSLAGEFIAKSLSVLRPFGRFLELGKMDIYQNSQLGLRPFQNNVSFYAVDMDQLFQERPVLARSIINEITSLFRSNSVEPLPLKTFPIEEVTHAFRFMAQRRNIGKIVVSLPDRTNESFQAELTAPDSLCVRPDSTYLITGGLGGLGLTVAEWMVRQGAKSLALLSRRSPAEEAEEFLQRLRMKGAEIVIVRADVSDAEKMASALEEIDRLMPPLRGIVHAAGVLDDGVLAQLDERRMRAVMKPKMCGAWNLHRLTLEKSLDFFLLFSSAAAVTGSPGQGNYAAANAFMDALAQLRRAQGLPALSINWGPWSEVGLAARPERGGRLALQGMGSISPQQGLEVLERLLRRDSDKSAQVAVMPVDWHVWREAYPSSNRAPLFFNLIGQEDGAQTKASGRNEKGTVKRDLLLAVGDERRELLENYLRKLVAKVLGLPASKLDLQQPVNNMGLDSLMAVELKNRIEIDLEVPIPVASFLKGISVAQLVTQILDQAVKATDLDSSAPHALSNPQSEQKAVSLEPGEDELPVNIDEFSDEEVEALLNEMLAEEKANS